MIGAQWGRTVHRAPLSPGPSAHEARRHSLPSACGVVHAVANAGLELTPGQRRPMHPYLRHFHRREPQLDASTEAHLRGGNVNRLEHKAACISGVGGRGQGQAAARMFAKEGAVVVGCDVDGEAVERSKHGFRSDGLEVDVVRADVTNPASVEEWIGTAVERHGGIDVLYNHAAYTLFAPLEDMDVEDWRTAVLGELDAVFLAMQVRTTAHDQPWSWIDHQHRLDFRIDIDRVARPRRRHGPRRREGGRLRLYAEPGPGVRKIRDPGQRNMSGCSRPGPFHFDRSAGGAVATNTSWTHGTS